MIKAIIFDFDGVLVESVDIKTIAFAKLFESEGKEALEKILYYHLKNMGISRFVKFRHIYENILKRGLAEKTFEKLCQRFSHLVVDEVVNAPYVDGAREFLDKYARQYKCFIASATPQEELEEIIKRRNMSDYFVALYGATKTKTDIIKEIIRNLRLSPEEVVFIGDALSEYEAGRINNVNFIARVSSKNCSFADIDCMKIRNLDNLKSILDGGF